MIRAVLDTNLFISMAIRPGGVPDRIRQAWQVGDFTLLASHDLLSEIHRVLAYPRLRALIRLSARRTKLRARRKPSCFACSSRRPS